MKILFLSRWFPYPQDNGSKIRIHNLLDNISKTNNVSLLSFMGVEAIQTFDPDQHPHISKIEVIPWKAYEPGSSKAVTGLFNPAPRFIVDTYSAKMENLIRKNLAQENFDLVIASQLSMASYYRSFEGKPAIFEELELGLFNSQGKGTSNLLRRCRRQLTWIKHRHYLSRLLAAFRACTVVSEQERELFIRNFPKHKDMVAIIPNCVNMTEYENIEAELKPNQIIFSGPFRYHVNYEAMVWFVENAFPLILEQRPQTQLIITGDHANFKLPSERNITLTGYVDDVKPLIASSRVSIAPLLSGGGTRLKILEAMAIGTPVVSTSKGVEGLDLNPTEHFLLADTPETFANHVINLFEDHELHNQLAREAKEIIREKYNWSTVIPKMQEIFEHTARMSI